MRFFYEIQTDKTEYLLIFVIPVITNENLGQLI